jgi:hypothetical protein
MAVRLTDLRKNALRLFAEYRTVDHRTLYSRLLAECANRATKERSLRRAIAPLVPAGILKRQWRASDDYIDVGDRKRPVMLLEFTITEKGVDFGCEHGIFKEGDKLYPFETLSHTTLLHEALGRHFYEYVRGFCNHHKLTLTWRSRDEIVHGQKGIPYPDDTFDVQTESGTRRFFAEYENTEHDAFRNKTSRLMRKLKRYADFAGDNSEAHYGFRRFIVVFVMKTEGGRRSILRWASKHLPYRMFWFTTLDEMKEADFSKSYFLTPKDFAQRPYSLIE